MPKHGRHNGAKRVGDCRIDVALGTKLFHHLLGLQIAYFEARQTGQTVARAHELENIRAFLTSSALTVLSPISLFPPLH